MHCLLLLQQALYLTFALSGIRCPQTFRAAVPGGPKERQGEALGNEALQFTRERVLQREVYIQVLQCDRGGSFIGLLHYDKNDINIALELLEEGLAQTIPFSLSRTPSKELYIEAENKAKKHRKGLWSLEGAFDEETETEETFAEKQLNGVVVSHIERFDLFYIQVYMHITRSCFLLTFFYLCCFSFLLSLSFSFMLISKSYPCLVCIYSSLSSLFFSPLFARLCLSLSVFICLCLSFLTLSASLFILLRCSLLFLFFSSSFFFCTSLVNDYVNNILYK